MLQKSLPDILKSFNLWLKKSLVWLKKKSWYKSDFPAFTIFFSSSEVFVHYMKLASSQLTFLYKKRPVHLHEISISGKLNFIPKISNHKSYNNRKPLECQRSIFNPKEEGNATSSKDVWRRVFLTVKIWTIDKIIVKVLPILMRLQ